MKVGVLRERAAGERRVALVPDAVGKLVAAGLEVLVESGAAAETFYSDDAYRKAGAAVALGAAEVLAASDAVLKVQRPSMEEAAKLRERMVLVALLQPTREPELIERLAERGVTAFSMERVPRITRAQPMDALSSQSTIAGYKAVLLGAASLGKLMPMLMTAAGTLAPAKVFVIGAGVAGLQAIATARRLGAVVSAFDVRPVVKEQVESLGAQFLEIELGAQDTEDAGGYAKALSEEAHRREQTLLHRAVEQTDLVITTALIPGKPAPKLITAQMVRAMPKGSVIVDLAAEAGGNCELTEPGKEVVREGVVIHGPLNLPSTMPVHASQMYARNISSFFMTMVQDGALRINFDDEIISATCVTHGGEVRREP